MSDKYGKSTDIAGQIFAQQPSGIGSAGIPLDLNTIQQNYASTFPMDLDFMDMLEEAADRADPDLVAQFEKEQEAQNLQKAQVDAAQDYIDKLSNYIGSANSQNKQALDDAKQTLVELDVSRNQIESVTNARFPEGIDASKGISGVMGPSIGGVASQIGQAGLDLIGGTGQTFSDIVTLGTGPEVAQTLLDPVSILLGGLGGTINYAESGKTTPVILGQTSSGMPVGLNIPDPRSVLEGGLTTLIPGAAAAASTAGALSVSGNEEGQDPAKTGVGITPAGALTAAAATDDDDTVKVNEVVRGDDAIVTGVKDPIIKDVIDPNKVPITVNAGDAIGPVQEITLGDLGPAIGPILTTTTDDGGEDDDDSTKTITTTVTDDDDPEPPKTPEDILFTLGEQQFEDVIETTVTPAELLAILGSENTDTITTRTAPTLTAALSGSSEASSGGAGSLLVPQQRVVQVDPRGVVDIEYLYDFEKGLDQPFEAFGEEEDELLKVAEGGQVKKFNNGGSVNPYAAGLAVLGGIFGANQSSGLNQPQGYQGGIPEYTATRTLQPDAFSQTTTDPVTGETVARRPGSMGRRYFSDVAFTPVADAGLPAVADQSQDQDDTVAEDGTTATLSDLIGSTGLANLLSSLGLGGTPASGTFTPGTSTSSTVTAGTPTSSTFTPSEEVTNTTRQAISNPLNDFFSARGFTTDEERPVTQDDLNAAITAGFTVDELAAGLGTSTDAIQAILDYQYAGGGTVNDAVELAMGGMAQGQGYYLGGATDGMADLIPATIDGTQPAALSDGEFVIPADVVSHLGNGNSDAGAKQLYSMMDRVRQERTGTTKQGPEIDPTKMMPA